MMKALYKRLLSKEAAAVYLDVSYDTIEKEIKAGRLPVVRDIRTGARLLKLDIKDLDLWIEARKEKLL